MLGQAALACACWTARHCLNSLIAMHASGQKRRENMREPSPCLSVRNTDELVAKYHTKYNAKYTRQPLDVSIWMWQNTSENSKLLLTEAAFGWNVEKCMYPFQLSSCCRMYFIERGFTIHWKRTHTISASWWMYSSILINTILLAKTASEPFSETYIQLAISWSKTELRYWTWINLATDQAGSGSTGRIFRFWNLPRSCDWSHWLTHMQFTPDTIYDN
jgi:hypothetical protein